MASLDSSPEEYLKERRSNRLSSYSNSPEDISAHFSDEGQIQADYHKRFAFELIQNADDAIEGTEGKSKVRFEIQDGALLVANTGRPINKEDVKALCTMSYTTKRADGEKRASIGHKGRGFSSVLEITDQPQVFSTGISFEFDKNRSRREVEDLVETLDDTSMGEVDGIPLMRLPFSPQTTPDRVDELIGLGYNTVFRFDLKNEKVEQDVIDSIRALDKHTVLFLQELERLEICTEDEDSGWKVVRQEKNIDSRRTNLDFVTVRYLEGNNKVDDEDTFALFSRNDVEIGEKTGGIDENTWGDVNYTQIGLALRVDEQEGGVHLKPLEESPFVHVFLPTNEKCPIPVLINGAFHTAISRTNIKITSDEDNYNGFLLQQVANLLATDVREYSNNTSTTIEEFIECLDFTHIPLEQREDKENVRGRFIQALQDEFASIDFVPRLDKLATGEILSDPGTKSIQDTVVPYHPDEREEIAEVVARIYGKEKLKVEGLEKTGWFPKTTLLEPDRASILESLGAEILRPEDLPIVLGSVPDESAPIYARSEDELAVDPILQVLVWTWQTISSDDDTVDQFKNAARESAVFPIGEPDENGVVRHVAKSEDADFFFPREEGMPDIQLQGLYFLSHPVYRPEANVSTQRQKELVSDLEPALESIWDVQEFQFERAAQSAIFPKLPGQQRKTGDEELRDRQVLDFIRRMSSDSVNSNEPLPYTERRRKALYRMCLLPVPTKSGDWERAYKVYFSQEWQSKEDDPRKVENLLDSADIDAPYLASPNEFPGISEDLDEDEREEILSAWRNFFQWIGVSGHIRLLNLYEPEDRRYFKETEGIKRPKNSLLSQLPGSDWKEYQTHLREALTNIRDRGSLEHIYNVQSIEFYDQLVKKASSDPDIAALLFNHIASWWEDSLREFQHPVLASHDKSGFNSRSARVFFKHEKKTVGTNLWLWQLKQSTWCPSNQKVDKPEDIWMATESVRRRFQIDGHILLPVLSESVYDYASESLDLLGQLGIRQEISRETFQPEDAKKVVETVATIFEDEEDDTVSSYLRQIKPVYRYVSELSPGLPQNRDIQDEDWLEKQPELKDVRVLCRLDEASFGFKQAEETYFVRKPDVLERIPVTGVPIFGLQEEDAIAFGTYFGMRDLENEATPTPDFIDPDEDKTENIREMLQNVAPFILCRLEAERGSQDLIDQDTNGMDSFIKTLEVVDKIEVDYTFRFGEDEKVISHKPDYFLSEEGREQRERSKPFVKSAEGTEQTRYLARALCEFLQVSQLEGVITLLNADTDDERRRYLKLAGAPSTEEEIQSKLEDMKGGASESKSGLEIDFENAGKKEVKSMESGSEEESSNSVEEELERRANREERDYPVYNSEEIRIQGDRVTIETEPESPDRGDNDNQGFGNGGTGSGAIVSQSYREKIDTLGSSITEQYERNRLTDEYGSDINADDYIFDIHNKTKIEEAQENPIAGPVLDDLEEKGLPLPFPGFDILTVNPETGNAERLIELKSSGHNTRTPPVTWNEWKTASRSEVQNLFYLYIAGNLRKDIKSEPYLREIPNPFQLLNTETRERQEEKKEVKVDVTSFKKEAEIHETPLSVTEPDD